MTPRFDLVDIAQTIRNRRRFIIGITVAAAVLGTVFYLLQKKTYKASSEFIVSNPQYADRANLFRTTEARFIDYFAGEDDIDRVIAIAKSDLVKNQVIDNMHLFEAHKLDPNKPKDAEKMSGIFKKNFDVNRTEYKNMEISYVDEDPKRAADVTNEAVRVIELTYRNYYNNLKGRIYNSIQEKIAEIDSSVNVLTDSLAHLRAQYGIYDIISPARENIVAGGMKGSGPDFGRGVELVQNVESVKDQLVIDRAKNISLLNEFSTGTKMDDMRFLQVISTAMPPVKAAGLGMILSVIACTLAGFFLSVVIALLGAYYKKLVSVER
jgi:uncharacterized protein involved in exopolysaccharide biosynthesis